MQIDITGSLSNAILDMVDAALMVRLRDTMDWGKLYTASDKKEHKEYCAAVNVILKHFGAEQAAIEKE